MFLAHRHDIDIEGACEAALVSLHKILNITIKYRLVVRVMFMLKRKINIGMYLRNRQKTKKICLIWRLICKKILD